MRSSLAGTIGLDSAGVGRVSPQGGHLPASVAAPSPLRCAIVESSGKVAVFNDTEATKLMSSMGPEVALDRRPPILYSITRRGGDGHGPSGLHLGSGRRPRRELLAHL